MDYKALQIGRQYVPGIYMMQSKCGKIYIGSAVQLRTRFMSHRCNLENNKHDNNRLQNYYNKYGNDSIQFIVLEHCDRSELLSREQFYIDTLNPFFNICKVAGATYGLRPWLNKRHTEYTKAKIKATNLATFSKRPKVINKIKEGVLTKEQNIERFAQLNKTPEARKRLSDKMVGHKYWLGRKHKPDTIANRTGAGNGRARKIYCIELEKTFAYCKEAAEYFNVSQSALCNSIVRNNKVLGKYTFKYAS